VPPYAQPAPDAPAPPAPDVPAPPAPDAPLPAEAPQPQASGPAYATYDQNGTFVDPAGGTGVYTPGSAKQSPAESWVDLMLDPRQV
jgi:phospholipid/cholesterol/gamma-HCH transport system substrate-binding protein